jgi:hypothetical protein
MQTKNANLIGWAAALFFAGLFFGANGCQNLVEGTASAQGGVVSQATERRVVSALEGIQNELRQLRQCECRR